MPKKISRIVTILLTTLLLFTFIFPTAAFAATEPTQKKEGGYWYCYINEKMVQNDFVKIKGSTYYYDKNGHRASGEVEVNGKYYYFDESTGAMLTNAYHQFANKKCYYGKAGARYSGMKKVGKYYYYFSETSGAIVKNKFKTVGTKTYYFDKKGRRASKTITVKNKKYKLTSKGAVKRYTVTCNHHYDNTYNTLSKHTTLDAAIAKIKDQPSKYRGQWYVYDNVSNNIVWPDLSTEKKKAKKAISWATAVGNDPRHGYTCEGERSLSGCDLDWPRWGKKGDYACSTLVATAYELFDVFNARSYCWKHNLKIYGGASLGTIRGFSSRNFGEALKRSGKFTDVTSKYQKKGSKFLQAGDIVITKPNLHTGMIISNGRIVEGAGNENGQEFAVSIPGDQRGGNELRIGKYAGGFYWVYRPNALM